MQLTLINKNNENILPICFIGKNRNQESIEYHKRVMDFWGIPMNYLEGDFSRAGHGDYIQLLINQTINSNVDYYWFIDYDCIPLRKDFVDILYSKISDKQSIFGPALATNHRNFKNHIYAAAFCLSFSKKVYLDLGRPDMRDLKERSDNSQELTWECQSKGKMVSFMWPTSHVELTDDEMRETGNPKYFNLAEYHRYGMSSQYGDLIFHGFVGNIKRSQDNFINKCKEVLAGGKKQNLDAIVISVNCADYLELSLPENVKHFDNYYVGTVESDIETIEICKKHGAIPVICQDPHNINGFKFDKGSCLQECFKQIKNRDRWVVLLDADIILPAKFKNVRGYNLDKNVLYGASRCIVWDYSEYLEFKNGKPIDKFENIPGGWGCGYYMHFYLDAPQIKNIPLEKVYTNGNIETDMHLLEKFHPDRISVGKLNFNVLHLGGYSLFENGRIDNLGRFDCVKGKKFKDIPNVRGLLKE